MWCEPMSDQYLNKAGVARLWEKVREQQARSLAPLFEAERYGPSEMASFDAAYGGMPLRSCLLDIKPIQEGSGDPSPSNVRAITGRTGLTLHRTGKNLVDQSQLRSNGSEIVWEGNRAVATASNARYCMVSTPLFLLKGGNTYTLSCYLKVNARASGPYEPRIMFRNESFVVVKSNPVSSSFTEGYVSVSYTVKTDTNMYLGMLITGSTAGSAEVEMSQLQLEVGSGRTAFETYQGQEAALGFPSEAGTVYGGTLDVLKGILTVTHGQIASYAGEDLPGAWISDRDVYAEGMMPSTGAQVVYELAESVDYPVVPQIVSGVAGINHVWSDSGDVTVEYGAFLQALQQELEAMER